MHCLAAAITMRTPVRPLRIMLTEMWVWRLSLATTTGTPRRANPTVAVILVPQRANLPLKDQSSTITSPRRVARRNAATCRHQPSMFPRLTGVLHVTLFGTSIHSFRPSHRYWRASESSPIGQRPPVCVCAPKPGCSRHFHALFYRVKQTVPSRYFAELT